MPRLILCRVPCRVTGGVLAECAEALKYLKNCRGDLSGLDAAAGVGVVISAEEIAAEVRLGLGIGF